MAIKLFFFLQKDKKFQRNLSNNDQWIYYAFEIVQTITLTRVLTWHIKWHYHPHWQSKLLLIFATTNIGVQN